MGVFQVFKIVQTVPNLRKASYLHSEKSVILFDVTHCVKSVQIRSFLWSLLSHIRAEYGEISISPY